MSKRRLVLLIAGAATVVAGPLGYRNGMLSELPALGLVAVGLLALLWMFVRGVVWLLRRRGSEQQQNVAAVMLALTAGVLAVPVTAIYGAIGTPPIHDITTDPEDPPLFDAIVAIRGDESNPLERGPDLAATQRAAYPDIQSLVVGRPPDEVLEMSRAAAEDFGWEVVTVDPGRGFMEATDTTTWFGFKDDVAVRLRPVGPDATRVDVRSISRVGGGDMGANAARIRRFLDALTAGGR